MHYRLECKAAAADLLSSKPRSKPDRAVKPSQTREAPPNHPPTCRGCHQWVNYFLHSGFLEIEGLKMSKSLKNFITIRWVGWVGSGFGA